MYRFFGKPKFVGDGSSRLPIVYALFIRERKHGLSEPPDDFTAITAVAICALLSHLLHTL